MASSHEAQTQQEERAAPRTRWECLQGKSRAAASSTEASLQQMQPKLPHRNHSLRPIFAKHFKQVQSPVGPPSVLIKVQFPSNLLSPSFLPNAFMGQRGTPSTAIKFAVANQMAWECLSCARSLACLIPSKRCSLGALQHTPPLLPIY